MTSTSSAYKIQKHHLNNISSARSQDNAIHKLQDEFTRAGNPFALEGPHLINIATNAIFSDAILIDVCRMSSLGLELYKKFQSERLFTEEKNLCAPITRNKLKLCSTSNKKVKINISGSVTELTADRSLFARLLLVAKSERELNLSNVLGMYEMSLVPRALFTFDGTMHLCPTKSKLIHLLVAFKNSTTEDNSLEMSASTSNKSNSPCYAHPYSVAIVDGMAELQALEKSNTVKTCADLSKSHGIAWFSCSIW